MTRAIFVFGPPNDIECTEKPVRALGAPDSPYVKQAWGWGRYFFKAANGVIQDFTSSGRFSDKATVKARQVAPDMVEAVDAANAALAAAHKAWVKAGEDRREVLQRAMSTGQKVRIPSE